MTSNVVAGSSASGVHRRRNLSGRASAEEKIGHQPMLRKCANPACTVPFRSLREGKLFLAETPPTGQDADPDGNRKKSPVREHLCLCKACAAHFTLRFEIDQLMMTVPLRHDLHPGWAAV